MEKQWSFFEKENNVLQKVTHVARALGVSPQFALLLLNRTFRQYPHLLERNNEEALISTLDFVLNPSLKKLLFPTFLKDIDIACDIVTTALKAKEKILIWGDYDVDGITSTALCTDFFKKHGFTVMNHVPCREEGYGINPKRLKEFIDSGVKVLISVDCGIADVEAIKFAREQGIKIIVTDHHIPQDELPPAHALINPYFSEVSSDYTKKDILLAGVGVAFFFMCHLNNAINKEFSTKCDMRDFIDLVALGTIADMMPLTGQNRILVKNGLLKIKAAERVGIRALKEVSGYAPTVALSAGQISFGLAPRINAAGRMDNPRIALDLLLSEDYREAQKLAVKLDEWNAERKKEEENIVAMATEQATKYANEPTLVLADDTWNQGIIGIVASRMIEKFYKPTFILTKDQCDGYFKGSGRSIRKFHLYDALCSSTEKLMSFGGHEYAAGLKIMPENVEAFRAAFNNFFIEKLGNKPCTPTVSIEDEVTFEQVSNYAFLRELEMLEPFGVGNSEPVYASTSVKVTKVEPFGYAKKHLKLEFLDTISGQRLHSKLWNVEKFPHKVGDDVKVAYSIEFDTYNNITQVNMKIKDIKCCD